MSVTYAFATSHALQTLKNVSKQINLFDVVRGGGTLSKVLWPLGVHLSKART